LAFVAVGQNDQSEHLAAFRLFGLFLELQYFPFEIISIASHDRAAQIPSFFDNGRVTYVVRQTDLHDCARDFRWKQRRSFRSVPVQQKSSDQHGVFSFLAHVAKEAPVSMCQLLKQIELLGKGQGKRRTKTLPREQSEIEVVLAYHFHGDPRTEVSDLEKRTGPVGDGYVQWSAPATERRNPSLCPAGTGISLNGQKNLLVLRSERVMKKRQF
jgi:hypothetical protein